MGDGAFVYFGYPYSYEDNAERAVHAALMLISNVAQLDVLGERLHVRIGIATGVVVVGELVNAGAAREQTALGETPNLAARLQAVADPDSIVIAGTTRRLVSTVFECRDLGAMSLGGFANLSALGRSSRRSGPGAASARMIRVNFPMLPSLNSKSSH